MIRISTASFGLLLVLGAVAAPLYAQGDSSASIDELYVQGQRELAPNWQPIGKNASEAIFLHKETRKEDGNRLSVWLHRELSSPEYFEKENAYLSKRERLLVDCKGSRLGSSATSYYSGRFASGTVVGSDRTKSPEMIDVVPDSIEDRIVKTACAPKGRTTAKKTTKAKASKRDSE